MKLPVPAMAGQAGPEAPHTGTTIVACAYPGGVVLGCDGRVSVGSYISNRASNKLARLADHAYLLRSGSAPDAQIVSDYGGCWGASRQRAAARASVRGAPCGRACCPPSPAAPPFALPLQSATT